MPSHSPFLWKDFFRLPRQNNSLTTLLKENILFSTLSRRELQSVASLVYERTYEPKEPIFEKGDRGFGLYLIAQGRVAIQAEDSSDDSVITTLGPGSFFGELALVEPENYRTSSALALERTVLVGFFKPDLMEIVQRRPGMGSKILFQLSYVLGRRLIETTEKLVALNHARHSADKLEELF